MKHIILLLLLVALAVVAKPAQAQNFDLPAENEPEYLGRWTLTMGEFFTYSDSLGVVTDTTLVGTIEFVLQDSLGAVVKRERYNLWDVYSTFPAQGQSALDLIVAGLPARIRLLRSVK